MRRSLCRRCQAFPVQAAPDRLGCGAEVSEARRGMGPRQFMVCRGGPDKFIVECIQVDCTWTSLVTGSGAERDFFSRWEKNDTDNRVLQVRWKEAPIGCLRRCPCSFGLVPVGSHYHP